MSGDVRVRSDEGVWGGTVEGRDGLSGPRSVTRDLRLGDVDSLVRT